ncbi:MAG: hypothetical protein B6244_00770 [Candidatus Cloacimonetes bacterium 4572_55]|nr:MAG: hypothetical protein B6244_00770 [Candidatus Cloacimonetes bacterium 4572_55]
MPFCPTCHWEYVEGTDKCSDCAADLVEELEDEKFPDDIATAECFVADDEIEAEIVKSILHQESIPCILTSQYSHLVHPFAHIGVSGQVGILVPTFMQEEVSHLIKEHLAQKGIIDDEFNHLGDDEDEDDDDDNSDMSNGLHHIDETDDYVGVDDTEKDEDDS